MALLFWFRMIPSGWRCDAPPESTKRKIVAKGVNVEDPLIIVAIRRTVEFPPTLRNAASVSGKGIEVMEKAGHTRSVADGSAVEGSIVGLDVVGTVVGTAIGGTKVGTGGLGVDIGVIFTSGVLVLCFRGRSFMVGDAESDSVLVNMDDRVSDGLSDDEGECEDDGDGESDNELEPLDDARWESEAVSDCMSVSVMVADVEGLITVGVYDSGRQKGPCATFGRHGQ